jgi:hypothetical protein
MLEGSDAGYFTKPSTTSSKSKLFVNNAFHPAISELAYLTNNMLVFSPWIKYEDAPRVTIDGLYLRDFLKNKVEMSAEMGRAVVRVLRMDEASRVVGPDGHTHYVMHDWAVET